MLILQPRDLARRMLASERSVRAGAALCSTATRSFAAWGQDLGEVDLVGLAAEELAAGGVGEDADVGVGEGAEDAGGLFGFSEVEFGVDAGR